MQTGTNSYCLVNMDTWALIARPELIVIKSVVSRIESGTLQSPSRAFNHSPIGPPTVRVFLISPCKQGSNRQGVEPPPQPSKFQPFISVKKLTPTETISYLVDPHLSIDNSSTACKVSRQWHLLKGPYICLLRAPWNLNPVLIWFEWWRDISFLDIWMKTWYRIHNFTHII